jgi:EAL domain-containing protein (putative c-di-GMP-specific phosphodiesterase class I)
MPDEFIPVGERDAGVIDRLTRWVVETAGTQSRRMGELGIPGQVAVNLSAKNLREVDFPDRLVDQLAAIGVAPATMTLEITETAATGDPTITTDILARLRLKGFQLAMDDFGTGFASMKALLNSPFSKLKIDKSFVSRLPVSRDARLIVKSVARMARDMGLQTVAEGVETKEIVDQLDAFGIDSVQGYYVGRPMGVERIRGWLDDWTQQRKPLQSADRV